MDIVDRIYAMHRILSNARYPVSRDTLQDRLECSRATVNRIIRDMRNYFGAPIEFDREKSGYFYSKTGEHPFELPGLWFNASELYALLTVQRLLTEVQPGLLESHISPLRNRIEQILQSQHMGGGEVTQRIRILGMASRRMVPENFQSVTGSLLRRKRLEVVYHSRSRDEVATRTISPQRLVHYRDNWYLDVWDHKKKALRSFSVDRIRKASELNAPAREISDKELDAHFATSYGIFGGKPTMKAVLRFTPERARWVSEEIWHPQQEGCFKDGCYLLTIPYSNSLELVMDILKHGAGVEVVSPDSLRKEVAEQLSTALILYRGGGAKSSRGK
jgi:predicted DNA-binding transcriptional regulator YafY